MDLETVSNVCQIIGTITIVGGTIFGLIQLNELKKQRRDSVAGELMRAFMDYDLANALTIIRGLPDAISVEELRRAGPEAERAAVLICTRFETMGLLAFQRIAPFKLVVELAGGIVVVMWRKLGAWLDHVRSEQDQPSWAEWFQWLAQQCDAAKKQSVPAHLREADWRP